MHDAINMLLTIGSLVAVFFLGWRGLAWAQYKWWRANKAKTPATVVTAAIATGGQTTLAQRKDATQAEALNLHSELDRYLEEIAKQNEEEELRKQLEAVALTKHRIRTSSALKADIQERRDAAGPMTTFIAMSEAELARLKKAKEAMDKASASGTAVPN